MEGDEGGFSAARAARGGGAVEGVEGAAVAVVDGFGDHHGGRHVGFHEGDGAEGEEGGDDAAGGGLRFQSPVAETDGGGVVGDVEVVFDGDGEAVEGAGGFLRLLEFLVEELCSFERGAEHGHREAVGELVGDGGPFAEGEGHGVGRPFSCREFLYDFRGEGVGDF